ncbi:MAG: hypothetical protein JSS35_14730 [Proteobacteria bacterium]|nr:hypothetical protein [Pseudomonadota bacterium]
MLFVLSNILLIFGLLSCVFALAKGGLPERIGAGVILANIVAYMVNEAHFQNQVVSLVIDGLTAVALLGVAVSFASFWLGAVMLLYALQFTMHAFYFVQERPRDILHFVVNNVIFFATSLSLISGTALAWRRRLSDARALRSAA